MEPNAFTTLKNSFYNILGYTWPIIFSIFITPFIVFGLGVKDYGIYIFINTILSLMGLLDLGLATATIKHIAEYHSRQEEGNLKRFLYSMNSIFLLIGLIGFLLLFTANYWVSFFYPNQAANYPDLQIIFTLAGAIFLISSLSGIFTITPNALQRYDISTKIGLVYTTITSLGLVLIVWFGYKLPAIFLWQLVLVIATLFTSLYFSNKLLPMAKLSFAWDWPEIIKAYKFGLMVFLSNISGSLLTYLDRLIIPIFLGPTQLTYYSLPGSIATKVPGVSNNLSGVIFPITVSLNSTNNQEKIQKLYQRSFRLLLVISCAICFSIIFLADKIMLNWLNADFAKQSTNVLIILALTNLLLAMSGPLSNFLLALNRPKFLAIINVLMALINAGLLFFLLPRYGINGAAWAYLLSVLPIVFMFYYTETRFLKLKGRFVYYLKLAIKVFLVTAIMFIIDKFIIGKLIINLPTLIILGPTAVLLYLACYKLFNFYEQEDWHDIKSFSLTILRNFKFPKNTKHD